MMEENLGLSCKLSFPSVESSRPESTICSWVQLTRSAPDCTVSLKINDSKCLIHLHSCATLSTQLSMAGKRIWKCAGRKGRLGLWQQKCGSCTAINSAHSNSGRKPAPFLSLAWMFIFKLKWFFTDGKLYCVMTNEVWAWEALNVPKRCCVLSQPCRIKSNTLPSTFAFETEVCWYGGSI